MKRTILFILLPLLLIVGCSTFQKEHDENNIIPYESIYYQKFSDELVNGKVYKMVDSLKIYLGEMKDGRKIGEWVDWYENGRVSSQGIFKDGMKDGEFTYYKEDGTMTDRITYKNGRVHGEWIKLDGWIKINSTETFKYGKLDGLSTYWNKGGELGSRGNYKDEEKDGLWTYWYTNPRGFVDDSKKHREEFYKNGELNGLTTSWYRSGEKLEEGTYKDGVKVGKWIYFNEDGSIKEVKEN